MMNNEMNNNQINNQNHSITNERLNDSIIVEDDSYIRAFIGEKYDKIKNSKFSIPTFFLGMFYMLYRKMYLYAFLILFLALIIGAAYPIAIVVLHLGIAILFKPLYMNIVKAEVKKIINRNGDKTKEEIISICKSKGGTSIVSVAVTIFGLVQIMIPIIFTGKLIGSTIELFDLFFSSIDSKDDFYLDVDKNNIVLYDYRVKMPNDFIESGTRNHYKLSYLYTNDMGYNACGMKFFKVNGYDSSEKLINDIAKDKNIENSIVATNINGIKWYSCKVKDDTYYNASTKDDKIYLLIYNIYREDEIDKCNIFYEDIINSITIR